MRAALKAAPRPPIVPAGLDAAGVARPALPVSIFGEDFSLVIRSPRRLRLARGRIHVLH